MKRRRLIFLTLHVLTWLVIAFGIAGVALLQQRQHGRRTYAASAGYWAISAHGWPMQVVTRHEWGAVFSDPSLSPPGVSYDWLPAGVLVNTFVGAVVVFSIAYTTECWLRSQSKLRLPLSSLFTLFVVVSATLATIRYAGKFFGVSLDSMLEPKRASILAKFGIELPWYFQLDVVVGLACVIHAVTSIFGSAIKCLPRISRAT